MAENTPTSRDTSRQERCEHCGQTISNSKGYLEFSWNLDDHKIIDVNDWMCEFLGIPKDEMIGASWLELPIFHPEQLEVLKGLKDRKSYIKKIKDRESYYIKFMINGVWTWWSNQPKVKDGNIFIESCGYAPIT